MFSYAVPRDSAGAGYAMVSDRYLVVLCAAASAARARTVWHAVGVDEADLDDLLDAIGDAADAVAVELVDAASRTVRIAVRGAGVATLASGERVAAAGAAWTRTSATDVSGIELAVTDAPVTDDDMLPFGRGVVRSSLLRWGAPTDPLTETLTIDRLPRVRTEATGAEPFSDTELSVRRPARPVLRIGSDRTVPLDRPVVLGRSLRPAAHPGARLVNLPSPQREISGTHLELRLADDGLHARDLDSTNGTIVRAVDGSTVLLRHGASVRVDVGAVLDLGEGAIVFFESGA